MSEREEQIEQFETAIAQLEAQRAVLGDAVVNASILALREKLAALSSSPPEKGEVELHGERRRATILLADVKGSTELAERVDTETWVEIMNRVFHLLGDAIYAYGGEIDQYRGDGLVAFFGAKAAHEDDPERAVRAALDMQEAVKRYAVELEAERGVELLLRIGINTGEVIAAEVGDRRQHSEDTAMGRAIALAARMESAAQPGTVLVTANTYRLTQTLFEWQALGEILVKGVSQPVTVYRPLAARAIAGKGRGIEGLSSPLVGRDEELAALRTAIDDLRRGIGGIVTIVGEAGLGKSRLVAEIRKLVLRADNRSVNLQITERGSQDGNSTTQPPPTRNVGHPTTPVQWVEGRCLSYGGSIVNLLWLDMLRSMLRVAPDAPPEAIRDALRAQVQALCPDCFDVAYPYLCRMMSLPLEDEYEAIRSLQGESLRAEIFFALQTLFESAAEQRPLVMVCEDLHWADATSLALLERVLALTDRGALLLICVFRPEVEHGCWQIKETAARLYRHRHTDLWLEALSAGESRALIGHLLQIEVLPAALRSKILDHAEGNPFYVEEIIRALIDGAVEGGPVIVYDNTAGHWSAVREIADIPIPDTLHGVLVARIDRLQEETRRVLRLASVIGRVFFHRVLAEIAREEAQLDTRLLTLQRQQLIRERARMPELEYIFKHELTREAAYNGLLKRERLVYHRQVAEALERLFPKQADEQAGLLAYHWERAEKPEKAVEYLVYAGQQAQEAYANEEAISYFERALVLLDHLPPKVAQSDWRLSALGGLGQVYFGVGKADEAERALLEAISLGKEIGTAPGELVRLYFWLGEAYHWQYRFDDQIRMGQEGLPLLGDEAESVEAALMNQEMAIGYLNAGNEQMFRELTYRTSLFLDRLPYCEELRPAYVHVVMACGLDKDVKAAEKWLISLEQKATVHHDLRALGSAHLYTGPNLAASGDLHGASLQYRQALAPFTRVGDLKHQRQCIRNRGIVSRMLGDLAEAEECVRQEFEIEEARGSREQAAGAHQRAGLVFLCRQDWRKAETALQHALQLHREHQWRLGEGWLSYDLGRLYLGQGNRETALPYLKEACRLIAAEFPSSGSIAFQIFPPFLAVLGGLEEAFQAPKAFHTFCRRLKDERPENYPYLVQWYLEPATVGASSARVLRDNFTDRLALEWIWLDPMGDGSYLVQDGLHIHAANGRSLWQMNWSAPRMLRPVSGDFAVQTVCVPVSDDRPAMGGLLLWVDREHYLRLDRGVYGKRDIGFTGCMEGKEIAIGRGRLRESSERFFLRLERVGERVSAFCSADGEHWYTVGSVMFPVRDPVQVGVHAIGNIDRTIYLGAYPEGTAIRFESFQLWQT